ncbi:MAG: DNA polymerase I [Clostridia bacterium]|nr:DNA polymerase I [Clostridia bacterium]
MSRKKLMLIDGNSILNRAYFGLLDKDGNVFLSTSDGLPTNAVFGFLNIMFKYFEEEEPTYVCVAFDLKGQTFRHTEFDSYKANRKGMDDKLAVQVPVIKEVLDAMNIKRFELQGYEADDLIGTLSLCAEQQGLEVVIVTGDKDALQLTSPQTRIKMPITRGGRTETEEYDIERFQEKYGIQPAQFIDVKGLMGDKSDNIPGVFGIGDKTALELVKKFGSIENLYENLDGVEKKSIREKLEAGRDTAYLSKRLATIERHAPFEFDILQAERKDYDREKLLQLFRRLEFNKYIDKFGLDNAEKKENPQFKCAEGMLIKNAEDLKTLKSEIIEAGQFSLYYLLDSTGEYEKQLVGLAVTIKENKSFYINLNGGIEQSLFLNEMKNIFENGEIKKSGHDVKGLMVFLKNRNIDFKGLLFDTMIAAYLLSPTSKTYTVSELASMYLAESVESIEEIAGKGRNFTSFRSMESQKLCSICVAYSEVILRLKLAFEAQLKENNQIELYFNIELPLVEVLAGMEFHGFKVNPHGLEAFSKELEVRIDSLASDIFKLAGEEFNINSPKQLGVILFEKLELPVLKKTKTGYSTDAEVLEQLESKHEIVSKILLYRQMVKLKSTYADGLLSVINPVTGRIHSSFNQTVTATGRISSTEPNLQNIPVKLEMGRNIRKVFVPENDDYILLDADYSQIELRVLAHITGDENMISAFINNEDIHTTTAARVFGIEKDEVTPLMRARAKAVNFGIVYGIGDFSLSKDIGVTRKEARRYIDEYLDKYPNIKKYMHTIVEQGKEAGFVTTLFNRRRYIPELKSSNFNMRSFGERVAMNTPIQGTAADIIKIAMVKVHRELERRKLKSKLVLQVHDELIIEALKTERDEVEKILRESMENAAALRVPLKADVKAGSSWYEAK